MEQARDTLLKRLMRYSKEGVAPFHMPGHKRNPDLAPYLKQLGAQWDITEIPNFDDLHEPSGILRDAMARTAALCGSDAAFFLVNGSTGGLLAAIRAATRYGDQVLVARNCHKAVYHGLELCGLHPTFLFPPQLSDFGCAASIPPEWVEDALEKNPEIRLIILTSPTYEGVISDIAAICQVSHRRNIPVLVDEAHGAHLGLEDSFPKGAVFHGADLVVQSYHKTLPSLTQTAMLHVKEGLISREMVARQLGIFQTSSPSYLLMSSLDSCVSLLENEKETLFTDWNRRLSHFSKQIEPLERLQILGHGKQTDTSIQGVYALDPSKIIIGTRNTPMSGVKLMEHLQQYEQIQLEMALEHYAVAMTGMGDTEESMDRLATALLTLDKQFETAPAAPSVIPMPSTPVCRVPLTQAEVAPNTLVSAQRAEGLVCGEYIWAYPPGIPLMIPGEAFSPEIIQTLVQMKQVGVRLVGTCGSPPETLAVLRNAETGGGKPAFP